MANFSDSITSAGVNYPAGADTVIPFEAMRVVLENKDATDDALVAFGKIPDGTTVAGLNADEVIVPAGGKLIIDDFAVGEPQEFGGVNCEVRIRSGAGTPTVILNASV